MMFSTVFRLASTSRIPSVCSARVILRLSNQKLIGHCYLSTSSHQKPLISHICLSTRPALRPFSISCQVYSQKNFKRPAKYGPPPSYMNIFWYCAAFALFMFSLAVLSAPFYRFFCESTGLEGRVNIATDMDKIERMKPVEERLIRVIFTSHLPATMSNKFKFKPQQEDIYVRPGETALAFYTATNPTDQPVIGISSYNMNPYEAAYYFNKIQCFCFEEQILMPGEEVDLPIFFYVDPDYATDPALEHIDTIILNYTFFEAKRSYQKPVVQPVTEKKEIEETKLVAYR